MHFSTVKYFTVLTVFLTKFRFHEKVKYYLYTEMI